jgi:hypothetical protein
MRPAITRCSYIHSVFFFTFILSVAPVTLLTQMPTTQLIHRTQLHFLPELPTAASDLSVALMCTLSPPRSCIKCTLHSATVSAATVSTTQRSLQSTRAAASTALSYLLPLCPPHSAASNPPELLHSLPCSQPGPSAATVYMFTTQHSLQSTRAPS